MDYRYYPLNYQQSGSIVTIELSHATNVLLLDSTNYPKYQRRNAYNCHGGFYDHSPAEIVIPRTGTWHLVVENSRVRSNVSVSSDW